MKPNKPLDSNKKIYPRTDTTHRISNNINDKNRTSRTNSPASNRTTTQAQTTDNLPTQTKFFVKFGEGPDNDKVLQKPRTPNYFTNLSEKFNAFNASTSSPKDTGAYSNLLGWDLDTNIAKTKPSDDKSDNQQLLRNFEKNFRQNQCLEENSKYYDRQNNRRFASVNPVVARIIEFMGRLNEHDECSPLGQFFDEKLQIIKLIYQNLRENYSMSDALSLCPDQTEMNIDRPHELLENNGKNQVPKQRANLEIPQDNLITALPPVVQVSKPSFTNLNIFDENFTTDHDNSFFDNNLISSILNDRQCFINEPEISDADRATSIADQIPLMASTTELPADTLDFTAKSGQFASLLINTLSKICFISIDKLDAETKRCESSRHVSKFAQDIQTSKLKSRRAKLDAEIRSLLPIPYAGNKFIEFSMEELNTLPLYKCLVDFLNAYKAELVHNLSAYDDCIRKFYLWFCQRGVADTQGNCTEFILTMHDIICNLIFDVNNRQFHADFKRFEFILQPSTLYMSDTVGLASKDPRNLANRINPNISLAEIKQPYSSLTMLECASESGFDEKAYILSKYQAKLNEISKNRDIRPPSISPPPPPAPLSKSTENSSAQLEASMLPSTPVLKNFIESFHTDSSKDGDESPVLKELSGEFDIIQGSIPLTPELKFPWLNETNTATSNISTHNEPFPVYDLTDDTEANKPSAKKTIFDRLTASKTRPLACPLLGRSHSRSNECSPRKSMNERASVFERLGRSRLRSDEHEEEPERKRSRSFQVNNNFESGDETGSDLQTLDWQRNNSSDGFDASVRGNTNVFLKSYKTDSQLNLTSYQSTNLDPAYMMLYNSFEQSPEQQQYDRVLDFANDNHNNVFHQNIDED